ncbi:nuclear transport factor 2 family protein [candidate division KSB1 bacterium]
MKKVVGFLVVSLMCVISIAAYDFDADSKADIEKVIKASYFNGAFNDLDTKAMRKGFHPDFAIFSADGEKISKYPIDTWIKNTENKKNNPNFDPASSKINCKIASLDITGNCAAAKIEISKDSKPVYTDYLSLLKFDSGWKIVAKVYHGHN